MQIPGATETLDFIRQRVAIHCEVDGPAIHADGELLGYGLDSLRSLELLNDLEDEFGVEISEHDPALAGVRTLAQLAAVVDRLRSRRG